MERNINARLPLAHPLLETWPATQACALTGNRTSDLLVQRPSLSPLSHTSQEDGNNVLEIFKNICPALAGVPQWTECQPANQKVTGSIPSQGMCLGCGPGP